MSRRTKYWTWYAVAWLPLALLYSVVVVKMQRAPLASALIEGFTYVAVPALLGVGVWHLTRYLRWPPCSVWRFVLVHGVGAVVFTVVWVVAEFLLIAWGTGFAAARLITRTFVGYQAFDSLFFYGAIAAISQVIRIGQQLRAEEALRSQAELAALRGQLNPHFLFNTLHTLTALVRRDPATAEDALERFGDMLRYVLDVKRSRREDGTLGDELQFVRNYLALEQLRLGERLRVVEEIDAETLDCVLPSLTLQPLVENAIKYGIAPRVVGGTLMIRAALDDEVLRLEIGDDGPGAPSVEDAAGVGLRAVRQRLETRYGSGASFDVRTSPGEGFRVRISLPAESASVAL